MPVQTAEERYLELLRKSLTRLIFDEPRYPPMLYPRALRDAPSCRLCSAV
jgi:hypothetical protein